MNNVISVMAIALMISASPLAYSQPAINSFFQHTEHQAHDHQHEDDDHNHDDHDEKAHQHDTDEDHQHGEHDDHEPHAVKLDARAATTAGISVATAESKTLITEHTLYGRLTLLPDGLTHVRARFDGIVKHVLVHTGEQVRQGQPLAVVESNESLKNFDVVAPQAGRVHSLQVTAGELTREGPLLTLINTDVLWAELQVFPAATSVIRPGQAVALTMAGQVWQGTIDHIVASDSNQPVSLARIKVDNAAGAYVPGTWVSGAVVTGAQDVAIAVDNRALHMLESQTVLFVKNGETYQARPVTVGLRGKTFAEITSGLAAGEVYVVSQSYLFKADAEKASAEHHH